MTQQPARSAAPAVQALSPYQPGKPIEELEREYGLHDSVKLASNESPLGPGPRTLEAIAAAARDIRLYPDGAGFALKQALMNKHGCSMDSITLGNGSNDLLVMIAEAFLTPQSEAVYSQYAFAVYPIAVQATGASAKVSPALPADASMPLGHDLEAMARLVNERTRVVFVANPNNPTGTWLDETALERFIAAVPPQTLVVVDEAYIEYVQEKAFPDASRWLSKYPHLIVTRTFSKAYGLAGLRVGYALSHPGVSDMLNRVRQPFNVNSVALAAAQAALQDDQHLQHSVATNARGMAQVCAGFEALGIAYVPSAGNFVLVDCARPALAVYEAMLRQGVIVRPVGNYQLPKHLRITIGTEVQNERMLAALKQAMR